MHVINGYWVVLRIIHEVLLVFFNGMLQFADSCAL